MKMMKWSVLAVAVAAASTHAVASQQDEATGFIEGSKLDLNTRLYYFSDDYTKKSQRADKKYVDELGLGLIFNAQSGFTQGTVGVGFDAWTMTAVKLDSGAGRHPYSRSGFFADERNGRKGKDNTSQAGGAVKLRMSNTTLKFGNFYDIDTPVFSMDQSRLLPESATGFYLTSQEIENLTLNAGHFTALSGFRQTDRDSFGLGKLDMIGGKYDILENLDVSYYFSRAKFDGVKTAKKHYVGANYGLELGNDQALDFAFNYYNTKFNQRSGEKDTRNQAWSFETGYSIDAHRVAVAYQRISGGMGYQEAYGYDGGGAIYLANSAQITDFDKKGERSWKVRYDLDLGKLAGLNGFNVGAQYIRGSKIDATNSYATKGATGTKNGKNWERGFDIGYTVQEGAAKDLNVRLRQASYRASGNGVGIDDNQIRLIVNYPLSIL